MPEQMKGVRVAAGRDLSHVPDGQPLRVEVGRADQKQPSLAVFSGDGVKHVAVDGLGDELCQRRGIGERGPAQQTGNHIGPIEILGCVVEPHGPQLPISNSAPERQKARSAHRH